MAAKGGVRPGAGRPKGVPNKTTIELKGMAQEYTQQALQTLAHVMVNGESEQARVGAANALLDRGYGRPSQALDVTADVKSAINVIERRIVRPDPSNG